MAEPGSVELMASDGALLDFARGMLGALWRRLEKEETIEAADLWIVLTLAARLAERGALSTYRHFDTPEEAQAIRARIARLLVTIDEQADVTDALMEGKPTQ